MIEPQDKEEIMDIIRNTDHEEKSMGKSTVSHAMQVSDMQKWSNNHTLASQNEGQ